MLKFIFSVVAGIGAYALLRGFLFKYLFFSGFSAFLVAFLLGLAAFILVKRFLKNFSDKSEKEEPAEKTPAGEKAKKAYDEGIRVLTRIRNKTRMVRNNEAAKKIQDICKIGIEIFDDIRKNPSDLRKIKTFINYYLESTEKIINQYVELSNRTEVTPEVRESLEKVEGLLDEIKKTFQKQLASLLEDDLLDLNVELEVLKKTMKHEG
jgi:5-bromo-4-chloroindolyl phosphate hydrolysis protein